MSQDIGKFTVLGFGHVSCPVGNHRCLGVEGRRQAEVARAYGVSPGWVSRLVARYRAESQVAFEPGSRRPTTSPTTTFDSVIELIVRLRKQLPGRGLDAGPATIAWHTHLVSRMTAVCDTNAYGLPVLVFAWMCPG